ncbi:hypothetical protein NC653_014669 [Populus alba x Populus x berolinensis]|uniref:Uncharacterized protein n=1 Tax=Populus alba x Populus x berolinensis TaxID=444605 RepID=A0AAD6QXT1_9ROSI|nr:hypothetical protein NC653_014664 [Populus alba x Populus x berolinensis]KAJ6998568.1 hypothetical protein NC653_014669 [Populus alba x Populus x berolinensis]
MYFNNNTKGQIPDSKLHTSSVHLAFNYILEVCSCHGVQLFSCCFVSRDFCHFWLP